MTQLYRDSFETQECVESRDNDESHGRLNEGKIMRPETESYRDVGARDGFKHGHVPEYKDPPRSCLWKFHSS